MFSNVIRDFKWLICASLYGIASFILIVLLMGEGSILAKLAGMVLSVIPLPVYLYYVLKRDRDPEPVHLLLSMFVWGAVIAYGGSFFIIRQLNEMGVYNLSPLIEETMKFAGFIGLTFTAGRKHVKGIRDVIVYSSMIGIGFATAQNAFLYSGLLGNESVISFSVDFMGSLGAFNSHAVFTSVAGVWLVWTVWNNWNEFIPVMGFVLAVIMHTVWDMTSEMGIFPFMGMWVVMYFPALMFVMYYRENKKGESRNGKS